MFQEASESDKVLTGCAGSKATTTVQIDVDLAFLGAVSTSGWIVNVSILIKSMIPKAVLKNAMVVQEFDLSVLLQNTFGLPIEFSWLPRGVWIKHFVKVFQNGAGLIILTIDGPTREFGLAITLREHV